MANNFTGQLLRNATLGKVPAVNPFTYLDYMVCSLILIISTSIGFYFMIKDRQYKKRLYKESQSTLMTNFSENDVGQMEKEKFNVTALHALNESTLATTNSNNITTDEQITSPNAAGNIKSTHLDEKSLTISDASSRVIGYSRDEIRKKLFDNYHLADKKLHFLPVSFSLTASFMSALTMMGWPPEFYLHGSMFAYFSISYLLAGILSAQYFIPHFYNGNYTTTYDYLNQRFSSLFLIKITKYVYLIQTTLYSGIVIYAPALALSSLNLGLDLWTCVLITASICTFYTTLGGLKAVIWTDVFQSSIMLTGFLSIAIKGITLYSFQEIINSAREDKILNFDRFDVDLRYRHTFWSIVVGGTLGLWLPTFAVNQTEVQRYLSCKSLLHAKLTLVATVVNLWCLMVLASFSGYVMNRFFKDNPLPADYINDKDKYIPFLIGNLFPAKGMMGLYVAAIYSGTLSTVSSSINSMSTVVSDNVIFKNEGKLGEFLNAYFSKGLVVVFGALCVFTAYLASKFGGILEAAMSINSLVFSPTLGLFILAIYFKKTEKIGAIAGYITGIITSVTLYLLKLQCKKSSAFFVNQYTQKIHRQIMTINHTSILSNFTGQLGKIDENEDPHFSCNFYMSYLYLSVCGLVSTLVVGYFTSFLVLKVQEKRRQI